MLLAPAAVLDVEAGALVPAPSTVQLAGASDMGAVLAELGRSLSLGDVKVRCTRCTGALQRPGSSHRLLHGASQFEVYDRDFEEWCTPATVRDIGENTRARITAGRPLARPAEGVPPQVPSAAGGHTERPVVAAMGLRPASPLEDSDRALGIFSPRPARPPAAEQASAGPPPSPQPRGLGLSTLDEGGAAGDDAYDEEVAR